jgi:transcription antitermination factor NusG
MERNFYEWYVVYTRQGMELKVVKEFAKRNIECYCPANKTSGKWWSLGKKNEQPLFTSCVFVKVSEKDVPSLKKINGVVNVLYWLGRPAVVKEDEIHMIKEFICNHTEISVEKTTVKAMNYVYGNSTTVASFGNEKYKLELPTLGYCVVAAKTADVKVVTLSKTIEAPQLQPQYSHAG